MARKKITTKGDNISLMLQGSGFEAVDKLLDIAAPKTKKLIQDEFEKILATAQQEWLVREKKSKGSKRKIKFQIRVNKDFELIASLSNSAPYAWAIKVGENSKDTIVPYGKRLADELLWKPAKKITDKIAESMANEILRTIK